MTKRLLAWIGVVAMCCGVQAQVKYTPDTLECHVIGFSVGAIMPGSGSASEGAEFGNMKDMYAGPYMDYAIGCEYKYKSNWMVTLDGDLWIGMSGNNVKYLTERYGHLYTPEGYLLCGSGYDGGVQFYNRGLAVKAGVGKILPIIPKNPNSGLLLKASGGWAMQKTVISQDIHEVPVASVNGQYAKLYDHLRNGVILTEAIGFYYMHNYSSYINFKITFEVSQFISWSSRPYIIDNKMGLNGKDNNRYFDLMYGLKLTWMFPLMGKTTYDYYYY